MQTISQAMKTISILSAAIILLLLAHLIYKFEFKYDRWDEIIKTHQRVSDSLRTEIESIVINVQKKDSLLLGYMSSLDLTLETLKKEAIRNGIAFSENLALQDSIRLRYCEEMTKLGSDFTPSNCK